MNEKECRTHMMFYIARVVVFAQRREVFSELVHVAGARASLKPFLYYVSGMKHVWRGSGRSMLANLYW